MIVIPCSLSNHQDTVANVGAVKKSKMAPITKWAATWQNQQSDCAPSEDSDQPGIRPVWSEFSLCA